MKLIDFKKDMKLHIGGNIYEFKGFVKDRKFGEVMKFQSIQKFTSRMFDRDLESVEGRFDTYRFI